MICKNCKRNLEEGDIEKNKFDIESSLCWDCEKSVLAKEHLKEFANLFIKHDFNIEISLDEEGNFIKLLDPGIILSFKNEGRISFLDKEFKEMEK